MNHAQLQLSGLSVVGESSDSDGSEESDDFVVVSSMYTEGKRSQPSVGQDPSDIGLTRTPSMTGFAAHAADTAGGDDGRGASSIATVAAQYATQRRPAAAPDVQADDVYADTEEFNPKSFARGMEIQLHVVDD